MNRCLVKGCEHVPTYQVGFRSNPPHALIAPQAVFTQVCVCDMHRDKVQLNDFMPLQDQVRFMIGMIKAGKQPVDFSRATVIFTPLQDDGRLTVNKRKAHV